MPRMWGGGRRKVILDGHIHTITLCFSGSIEGIWGGRAGEDVDVAECNAQYVCVMMSINPKQAPQRY